MAVRNRASSGVGAADVGGGTHPTSTGGGGAGGTSATGFGDHAAAPVPLTDAWFEQIVISLQRVARQDADAAAVLRGDLCERPPDADKGALAAFLAAEAVVVESEERAAISEHLSQEDIAALWASVRPAADTRDTAPAPGSTGRDDRADAGPVLGSIFTPVQSGGAAGSGGNAAASVPLTPEARKLGWQVAPGSAAPIAIRSEPGLQCAEELARRERLDGGKTPSAALQRLYCEYIFYRSGSWLGDGPEPVDDEPDGDFDIGDSVFMEGMNAWILTLPEGEYVPPPSPPLGALEAISTACDSSALLSS